VAQWAEQSHELAVLRTYGELPGFACGRANAQTITLSASYVRSANEYVPEQLVKAGVRIAAVLNATLK
jgi:S1/P1 Nuclease.